MKPSTAATLALLRKRGEDGLSPLEAFTAIGTMRLGARIWDLRADGFDITSTIERTATGKHVSRYRLREAA